MTVASFSLDGLYEISRQLVAALPGVFLKADPHDAGDPEGSDLLWFQIEEAQPDVDGEVITLAPSHPGIWFASHDAIYNVGGSPTFWDASGNESQIIKLVADYLSQVASLQKRLAGKRT